MCLVCTAGPPPPQPHLGGWPARAWVCVVGLGGPGSARGSPFVLCGCHLVPTGGVLPSGGTIPIGIVDWHAHHKGYGSRDRPLSRVRSGYSVVALCKGCQLWPAICQGLSKVGAICPQQAQGTGKPAIVGFGGCSCKASGTVVLETLTIPVMGSEYCVCAASLQTPQ